MSLVLQKSYLKKNTCSSFFELKKKEKKGKIKEKRIKVKKMIKLKNVSKYYYSKGVVATGFSHINLELNMGEFVAITGESGSGKTTLLNVISGLDTYEEGEMYINGEETSHYIAKDFEDYRRKNIGNIYQNFNLVNSYTVYQNIALVLMLNGENNIKERVLELIKKVDLYPFRNTKVSKLSGGQKQRVAIARALAKDVPIIIADEPTGNLDKRSAESVLKLLSELSKDKLVIIVTHNYEQIEPYVTRKITMHDGRILEDRKIKPYEKKEEIVEAKTKNLSVFNKLRLGLRNTFNIIPKFILLLLVYLFVVGSLLGEYASFQKEEMIENESGENYVFNTNDLSRIEVKKKDNSPFTEEEIETIQKMKNVKYTIENDLLLDTVENLRDEENNYWIDSYTMPISVYQGKLDIGKMPEDAHEAILVINEDSYYFFNNKKEALEKNFYYLDDSNPDHLDENYRIKLTGIQYNKEMDEGQTVLYVSDEIINKLKYKIHQKYSKITVRIQGKNYESNQYSTYYKVTPSPSVPVGEVYVSEEFDYMCPKNECLWTYIDIFNDNLYFSEHKAYMITKKYNKKNINQILYLPQYDKEAYDYEYNGRIYINENDYKLLYSEYNYQISVFAKNKDLVEKVNKKLTKAGYQTLVIKDSLVKSDFIEILRIIKLLITLGLIVALFFISYFIIKIILKSRNTYFSIIRMLGGTKKITRQLLTIELFVIANLAFLIYGFLIYGNHIGILHVEILSDIHYYFHFKTYCTLYAIVVGMSIISSFRYSRKLFKDSVMVTIKEEV